ncbi:MAG: hypothetical protein GY854_01735 [Deltaproteobacteria bacterium]|nr:hypothetical protein [Deltaproteobacteria bacterium]
MSIDVKVYCCMDPAYSGGLDVLVASLRDRGHQVIIGDDIEEILVRLGKPTAIFYTFASEGDSLSVPFQTLMRQALEQSIPMILVGPGNISDGLTLYYPGDDKFDERHIPSHMVADVIEGLEDNLSEGQYNITFDQPIDEMSRQFEERLVDVVGDDSGAVRIETEIMTSDDTRITTTVSRRGNVVVREEQDIDVQATDLAEKMAAQHLMAVNSYTPARPSPIGIKGSKFRGEVSAPFPLPPKNMGTASSHQIAPKRLTFIVTALLFGASICFLTALLFSTLPGAPMPHVQPRTDGDESGRPQ